MVFSTGRGHRRARILYPPAPAQNAGADADDGYFFVPMIHNTARAKAQPVMG